MANDIYAGQFIFAGQEMTLDGRSPFGIQPPSREWAEALLGFGWLRHLHAANSALARENAQDIVGQFFAGGYAATPTGSAPAVVARRVLSFLAHSPLLLEGADHAFYVRYLAAVRSDASRLMDTRYLTDEPALRLNSLIAIVATGLCVEGAERLVTRHGQALADALDDQILPDGGHVSRNPRILVDLMLDLLPLRATYAARNIEAPPTLMAAMDRIVPFLKMMRHGDGSIALFNGMGSTQVEALATIFTCHDIISGPASDAARSGYARLEQNGSLLLVDSGVPPPFEASSEACASASAFEFSHGRHRIFVSCGMPRRAIAYAEALRTTAAVNATVIADTSSAQFVSRAGTIRIAAGPETVTLQRVIAPEAITLRLTHDGYLQRFGVMIERDLTLATDGTSLSGQERITGARDEGAISAAVIRFHLHPQIIVFNAGEGSFLLDTPDGQRWLFVVEHGDISLEESTFFGDPLGARRTLQFVLTPREGKTPVGWSLRLQPTGGGSSAGAA